MLNKRPIFIVGYQRGGTNILLNFLRSHPEVCSPRGELREVFMIRSSLFPPEPLSVMLTKLIRYIPIVWEQKENVLSTKLWRPRKPFTSRTMERIDRVLFHDKLAATGATQNRYKTEDQLYTDDDIRASRLLCKNVNGLIFLTDEIQRMYPDATFFGLVRNGLAICEGQIRRGYEPAEIAKRYATGCRKMIEDEARLSNYSIIRYEDLVSRPREYVEAIYKAAGLDASAVQKIRLETKPVIGKDGKYGASGISARKELVWHHLDEFARHFRLDVNENQIRRLTDEQTAIILKHTQDVMAHFQYV